MKMISYCGGAMDGRTGFLTGVAEAAATPPSTLTDAGTYHLRDTPGGDVVVGWPAKDGYRLRRLFETERVKPGDSVADAGEAAAVRTAVRLAHAGFPRVILSSENRMSVAGDRRAYVLVRQTWVLLYPGEPEVREG